MQVIAHRGANREALENTFSAFDLSLDAGVTAFEFDVQVLKDDSCVISHDSSLQRIFNIDGNLIDLTKEELVKLGQKNNLEINFLDEMLDKYLPQAELNIEIKATNPKLNDKISLAVANSLQSDVAKKHSNKIIVSCFRHQPLLVIAKKYPNIERACLWEFGYVDFRNIALNSPQLMMEKAQTTRIHPYTESVNEYFMEQAALNAWSVYTWSGLTDETNNTDELWSRLSALGVNGHCTNLGREMLQWQKNNKERISFIEDYIDNNLIN